MTTITLCTAPCGRVTLVERTFQPHHNLQSALSTLAAESNVSPPWQFKVWNQDGDQLNVTEQRNVGVQPLSVEIEASTIQALRATVEQQGSDLAAMKVVVEGLNKQMMGSAQIHLMTCAAQILQSALGAPFVRTYSHKVQDMATDPMVVALSGLAGLSPAAFAQEADQLIDRRNNTAAHQSLATKLAAQVAACQALITPALRQKHPWESWMVDNYDSIKNLDPSRFC